MAAPWEKYQAPASQPAGPWQKYATAPAHPATVGDRADELSQAVPPDSPEGLAAAVMSKIRGDIAAQRTPAVAPDVGPNTSAEPPNPLPGVNAFANGVAEGIPVVGPLVNRAVDAVGSNIASAITGRPAAEEQQAGEQRYAQSFAGNEGARQAGNVAGTIGPLGEIGATPLGGKMLGTAGGNVSRMVAAPISSAAIGGADTLARGGSIEDARKAALIDAASGGLLSTLGVAGRSLPKPVPNSPALADLEAAKNAAYSRADQLGVQYSEQGYDDFANSLVKTAKADNISPTRHPKAFSMLQDIVNAPAGTAPTLTELDQLRQVVRRDVANSPDAAEAHFGEQMIDGIDSFIDNASAGQMAAGSGPRAAFAIKAARSANQIYRKAQTIDDLVTTAKRQAASTGSGGNINNTLRQGVRRILESPTKSAGFTPEEKAAMEAIVAGSPAENAARLVGKLSPGGNGLMTALSIGGAAANPLLAVAPAVGAVAKLAADNNMLRKLAMLRDMIAGRGAKIMPLQPPKSIIAPAALTQLENNSGATGYLGSLAGAAAQ